jgi:inositol-pentakisphosphate 2-kinase
VRSSFSTLSSAALTLAFLRRRNQPSTLTKLERLLASLSPGPASRPHPPSNAPSSSHSFTSSFVSSLLPTILVSPLLPSLQRLQSSLDSLDIEGLADLLQKQQGIDITSTDLEAAFLGAQPSMEEWSRWAKQDLPSLLSPSLNTAASTTASPPSPTNPRAVIFAFLLSASFKDCSIIIRLPLPSSANSSSFSPLPPGPTGTVKAIDLDPKPINRLGKYWRMDQEIVKSWGEMLDSLGEDERAKVRRCQAE